MLGDSKQRVCHAQKPLILKGFGDAEPKKRQKLPVIVGEICRSQKWENSWVGDGINCPEMRRLMEARELDDLATTTLDSDFRDHIAVAFYGDRRLGTGLRRGVRIRFRGGQRFECRRSIQALGQHL